MQPAVRVSQLDVRDLARRIGVSERELLRGIRRNHPTIPSAGAIAAPAEHVAFFTDNSSSSPEAHRARNDPSASLDIDVALVSLAARPGVLDTDVPKCLLPIGDLPLIGHVLNQLHAGGITRFVIVLGAGGGLIRAAIRSLPVAHETTLEFVDLGTTYAKGFARSLLAASALLGGLESFLLCTPDHIFDASIVNELRTRACHRIESYAAIALVEDNVRSVSGALPPTAVHVALADTLHTDAWPTKRVTSIGKNVPMAVAIEAGLYRCDGSLFSVLTQLSVTQPYFTVAQAMQLLAADGKLGAAMTHGRRWLALETREQMDVTLRSTVDSAGRAYFPWQVHIARADSFSCHPLASAASADRTPQRELLKTVTLGSLSPGRPPPQQQQRLILPLVAPDVHSLVPSGTRQPGVERREFLLVPAVASASPPPPTPMGAERPSVALPSAPSMLASMAGSILARRDLAEPLLARADVGHGTSIAAHVDTLAVTSSVGAVSGTGLQAISIELQESSGSSLGRDTHAASTPISPSLAYLIEMAHPTADAGDASTTRMLALPMPAVGGLGEAPLLLPPAITAVTLGTRADESATVDLTVEKRVPLAGWALLATALITSYSSSPASDLQQAMLPPDPAARGSAAFLHCAWRGTASTFVCTLAACCYHASRHDLYRALSLQLEHGVARKLLGAGIALTVYFGACNAALEYTSIAHAALFSSCSSLHLVIGQLALATVGRAQDVPRMHVIGVMLGSVGAFLATRDAVGGGGGGSPDGTLPPEAYDSAVSDRALFGDLIAVVSGLGATGYLVLAESLRVDLDPLALYTLVMAQFGLYSLGLSVVLDAQPPTVRMPLDAQHGVLGWLEPIPARLACQMYLAVVVDLIGNFGFIAVLAYVPALVVAAVMLLGPLTAALEGIAVGVDEMPGPWTLSGAALITAGSGVIAFTSREQSATVEIRV